MNSPLRVKTFEFRRELSRMIRLAHENPIEVLQHGEPVAVLLAPKDYEELVMIAAKCVHKGSHR